MYGWIRDISADKASNLISHAKNDASDIDDNLINVVPSRDGKPVGADFPKWIEKETSIVQQ